MSGPPRPVTNAREWAARAGIIPWYAVPTGPRVVTDGLLAGYRFDEGSGQVLTDFSGNNHDGRIGSTTGPDTNDPTWVQGGLAFDGVDDYVEVPTLTATGGDGLTVFALIRPRFAPATGFDRIVTKATRADGSEQEWVLQQASTAGAVRFEYGNAASVGGNVAVANNEWCVVGATVSVASGLRSYKNASAVGSSVAVSSLVTSAAPVRFGTVGGLQSETFYCGDIGYVLIYNRELTSEEWAKNYAAVKQLVAGRGIVLP